MRKLSDKKRHKIAIELCKLNIEIWHFWVWSWSKKQDKIRQKIDKLEKKFNK